MSELLESVKRSFYHEVIGYRDAESRLEGREGSYLFRESDIKPGLFIISYVQNSSVTHILTPNKNGKFFRQTLEEAVDIAADIISASQSYIDPVPPPPPSSQTYSESETESSDTKCYCCNFTSVSKVKLDMHHKTHKVIKCQKCSKYFKSSTYAKHKRLCNNTPENLSCSICGYVTVHSSAMWRHRKNHILRPFLCRDGGCRRCFKTEEGLNSHRKHKHGDEGFKCERCPMSFKHRYERSRHVQKIHLNARVRCSVGWFRVAGQAVQKQKAKGRTMLPCKVAGCSFESRAYEVDRMARHIASKHPETPRSKKPHECRECKKSFAFPYLLHRHEKRCKLLKARSKRVVGMVTNSKLIELRKQHPNCPTKTFVSIFKGFSKQNPDILFEGNLQDALQDSINELKKWFSADLLTVQDSKGLNIDTVIVLVKDLHFVIRSYITRKAILKPQVAIVQDGGNNKYLIQLSIFDKAKLGLDECGYSSGGRRRSLIIGACNRCKETPHNLNMVLEKLHLADLEYPTIFPCDLSAANKLMGIGCHTSYSPCIYCEAFKLAADGKTWTTKKALYWSKGARRRTIRMIMELRRRFLTKWGGRLNSAAAKADIKFFASVVGWPIELPEAMLDLLVLLVIPPDPLHCCLLGRFKYKSSLTI